MQSSKIKVGGEYAYNNSPSYGQAHKVVVVEVAKLSHSSWSAKDHPERIGETSYYRDIRHGKWQVVVTGDLRYRGDESEIHVVSPAHIRRTWAEQQELDRKEGELRHAQNLVKRAHQKVADKRQKQLQDVLDHYGIEGVSLRQSTRRWSGHAYVTVGMEDFDLANLIGKLTGVPVELAAYPEDED